MGQLIPDHAPEAMAAWHRHANALKFHGAISSEGFYKWMYEELSVVNETHGCEITKQIFDYGRKFTFDPFEIRGAADYLSAGKTLEEIEALALAGMCDANDEIEYEIFGLFNW